MPIQPFIFIGVGGTGGKTIGVIRKTLDDALTRIGWDEDWPDGWQFVHIDVPADPDADTADTAYALPRTCYVPLTTHKSTYLGFHDAITQELKRASPDHVDRYLAWESWRPEPASAVRQEIPNGAGQYRAIGRVCVLKSLRNVDQALTRAWDKANGAEASPQLRRVQQRVETAQKSSRVGDTKPVIFVIGSVSGGSGSGMFLDVCDVLRAQGHREINGMLFTPEVFEKPSGDIEPGVAPNTFMALSEVANSMWTHAEADAPLSRDRMFGRAGVGYPVGHGGPSTVFLVGRRNRSVTFDNAGDVYKIVGRSLGELALDEALTTEIVAYDLANSHAIASGMPDSLNLSPPNAVRDVAAFRGLGFSRLTVGRDFFDRYATDRLLRRVTLRLLDGHLERRRSDDPSSDEELKQQVVQEVWPAFLRDSQLDEVKEMNYISDPLNAWDEPEVTSACSAFATKLRSDIAAGAKRGEVNHAQARQVAAVLVTKFLDPSELRGLKSPVEKASTRLALTVRKTAHATLERVILRSMASYGLPVTVDLVDRLIDRSREGVASLTPDRHYVERQRDERLAALPQPPAGSPTKFPVGSVDDINQVVGDAERILRRSVQLSALELAQDFLDDMTDNLLEPWRRALADADGLLRLELRPSVGTSPLDNWPGDVGIPEYLRPSKVEYLLDGIDDMPDQFIGVIERSVDGAKGMAAVITAIQQIVAGDQLGKQSRARPVVRVDQEWMPRADVARERGKNRATAKISVALGLEDLKARTHDWLTDREKYAGQFLRQSLGDYLTDDLASAPELKKRQSKLVGHFEAMVKSSLPLVDLDSKMTNLIHGSDLPNYNLHVSELNVPSQLADLRAEISDAAQALLGTPQQVTFTNDRKPDAIMMTLLATPYHMLEVSSVMRPVSKQWSRGGNSRDLWLYRRARPLGEWVPLGPDARKALIAGWFAARLLGDARVDEETSELSVRVSRHKYVIPRGVRARTDIDHVGQLLEALPSAMLQCYNGKTLEGIAAYQHLIALGASLEEKRNALAAWLVGSGDDYGPDLEVYLADSSSRKEAAAKLVRAWKNQYSAVPELLDEYGVDEAQKHPTFEVFTDVLEALAELLAVIDRRPREGSW